MRAAICTRYGPPEVVEIQEVETPEPKPDEVLARVRASTVASGDHRVRAFDLPRGFRTVGRLAIGFRGPRNPILGTEFAGEVAEVGKRVKGFQKGDAVLACRSGTHAESVCVREDAAIVKKPERLDFDEAVALPFGGLTALRYWRAARLARGQRVLVYGASGSVGTAAVQTAKHYGAHVTAVCSGANARLVASLGADAVIDYTKEDFTRSGDTYDAVFDTVGKLRFKECKPVLGRKGLYLPAVASLGQLVRSSLWPRGRIRAAIAVSRKKDLQFLADLAEQGRFKPVIDRRFPFEAITEAHRYVDGGHKKGNVVVTFGTRGRT